MEKQDFFEGDEIKGTSLSSAMFWFNLDLHHSVALLECKYKKEPSHNNALFKTRDFLEWWAGRVASHRASFFQVFL